MLPCLCRKTRSGRAVLFVGVFCRRRQDFRRDLRHCDKSGCACSRKAGKKELSSPEGKCLLLDGLQDPANVGAVLRTAAASGYDDVYLCGCADPFSAKSLRAGMSAQYVLNIFEGEREKILDLLSCCQLVCADMSGENVFTADIAEKHALVLGSEGGGVSSAARMRCEKTVSIPMKNNMESLNVAVSAGILMYLMGKNNF